MLLYHLFAFVSTRIDVRNSFFNPCMPSIWVINSTLVILTKSERRGSEDAWKDPGNFSLAMLHQGVLTTTQSIPNSAPPFY